MSEYKVGRYNERIINHYCVLLWVIATLYSKFMSDKPSIVLKKSDIQSLVWQFSGYKKDYYVCTFKYCIFLCID